MTKSAGFSSKFRANKKLNIEIENSGISLSSFILPDSKDGAQGNLQSLSIKV